MIDPFYNTYNKFTIVNQILINDSEVEQVNPSAKQNQKIFKQFLILIKSKKQIDNIQA